ncbi:restriction endonuclease subunit S [Pseudomonas aeruginosa]|nr:restriction endonuclease subunit S [Pseudomonas aeruginosa]HEJ5055352.1 restriction endonuclease subunit S [Pseudomonas aeruginosa]
MTSKFAPFTELLSAIVDNRGRTCPVGSAGLPLIATNCVSNETLYPSYETARFVDGETYRNWFRGHPEPGDILFVCKGSPGRTNLVPPTVDFCIAQDMVAVRADPEKVNPGYLFAVLRSSVVQNQINNMHVGTLIPHFKKGDFDKLLIPLTDEKTQAQIGAFYFEISRKIDLNRRINRTLEAMAQAIFKSWFVDFDPVKAKIAAIEQGQDPLRAAMRAISGKNDAKLDQMPREHHDQLAATAALFPDAMEESELGEIPKGWAVGTLADLCHLNPESWSARTLPDTVRYVDLANAKVGEISEVQSLGGKDIPSRARRILRYGDTIVGTVRPGNRSFALIGEDGLTGSTGFAVLRPKSAHWLEFVHLVATSEANIERLAHLADGGAYPAVRPEIVVQEDVAIPTKSIVQAFSQHVKPLFAKILSNRKSAVSLAELRDTLLPKLLSGEISVETLMNEVAQ